MAGSYSEEGSRPGLYQEYREEAVFSSTAGRQGEAAAPAEPVRSSGHPSARRVQIQEQPTKVKELEVKV